MTVNSARCWVSTDGRSCSGAPAAWSWFSQTAGRAVRLSPSSEGLSGGPLSVSAKVARTATRVWPVGSKSGRPCSRVGKVPPARPSGGWAPACFGLFPGASCGCAPLCRPGSRRPSRRPGPVESAVCSGCPGRRDWKRARPVPRLSFVAVSRDAGAVPLGSESPGACCGGRGVSSHHGDRTAGDVWARTLERRTPTRRRVCSCRTSARREKCRSSHRRRTRRSRRRTHNRFRSPGCMRQSERWAGQTSAEAEAAEEPARTRGLTRATNVRVEARSPCSEMSRRQSRQAVRRSCISLDSTLS